MLGQLTENEIVDVLEKGTVGRIGCTDGNRIYIVPVTYIFRGDHVLCHSNEGMKIHMMRSNPNVCFEVDDIRDNAHWKSIIAWGIYQEITAENELAEARKQLTDRALKHKTSITALPPEASPEQPIAHGSAHGESVYYKIKLEEVTGRFEHAFTT